MSNVAKLKKKAAEFEQKKQFEKALGVYLQILNGASPGDEDVEVSLYNRVGDLMLRQGNTADAVTYYEKAVDLYSEGGFFNNAIALCNKILRQSPGRSVIYYKLGKISAKKGFRSDAKQNFLEYADRMQQAGQIDEAFRALKEFADLVPDQEDVRLMLAEQLSRKDRKAEALEQLQLLYDRYEAEGRGSEAKATLERMRAIDPAFEPKSSGAAARVEQTSGLVFLDVTWDGSPQRPGTPSGRPAVGAPLGRPTPSTPVPPPTPSTPITAPSYLTPSRELETPSILPPPADVGRATPVTSPATLDLERAGVLSPLDGLSTGSALDAPGGSDLTAPLLGLESTSVAGRDFATPMSGSAFAALTLDAPAYETPFDSPPHDLVLPGELPTLGNDIDFLVPPAPDFDLQAGSRDSALLNDFEAPSTTTGDLPMLELDDRFDDDADDESAGGGSELTFLDTSTPDLDLPFLETGDDAATAGSPHDVEASELALAAELDAPLVDEPEVAADGFETLDLIAPADPEIAALPEPAHEVSAETEALYSEADEDVGTVSDISFGSSLDPSSANVGGFGEGETDDDAEDSDAAAEALAQATRTSHATHAQAIAALRARVDGAPEDGALRRRLAELLLDAGEREEGTREMERAMAGFERVGDIDQARSVVEEVIRLQPNSVAHHQKRVEFAFRANDRARLGEAYLELADALFRTGQGDKARAVYERVIELSPDNARARAALNIVATPPAGTPTFAAAPADAPAPTAATPVASAPPAPAPTTAPSAPSAPAAAPSTDESFVNLGDWLRDDVHVPKSTRMVTDAKEPQEGEEFDFADMLAKFKQGVAENVDEDDHESHYDLGVAFKEMGLVDEAISEFQKALRSTSRRVRTYEALGQCFLEQSQFQVATTVLQRALAEPGIGDEHLVGVLYLLGYAAEALGHKEAAVTYYQRVFSVDIRFRDVTDRLNALQQTGAR